MSTTKIIRRSSHIPTLLAVPMALSAAYGVLMAALYCLAFA